MKTNKGFTLVELLIVVVILGIVAAIALPKFSNASAMARGSMLADNLRIMRMQIEIFKNQHIGVPPGYPGCDVTATPTSEAFVTHITTATTGAGAAGTAGTPGVYGPYFSEMPANPINGLNTVDVLGASATFPTSADNSHGFTYQPNTQNYRADSIGSDEDGTPYIRY